MGHPDQAKAENRPAGQNEEQGIKCEKDRQTRFERARNGVDDCKTLQTKRHEKTGRDDRAEEARKVRQGESKECGQHNDGNGVARHARG